MSLDPKNYKSEAPDLTPIYFDVEEGIKFYLPSLRKLISGNFSWSDLNKQWNRKVNETRVSANGQNVKQMMTLLTLTANAYKKQGFFEVQFLAFIDHTIKILISKMTPAELELIKGNLYDLLIYSDSFLDHLGEIFVLADLFLNKPYKLLKSEFGLKEKSVPIVQTLTDSAKMNRTAIFEKAVFAIFRKAKEKQRHTSQHKLLHIYFSQTHLRPSIIVHS